MPHNKLHIHILTDHLILRTLTVEDVTQDYADWLNEPQVNKFLDTGHGHTIKSCQEYVTSFESRPEAALVGIFCKDTNLHIGNMTLSPIDWRNKSAWVGIALGRKTYQGRGLAKEALVAFIQYCFKELGFHAVRAGISVLNQKSLGFFLHCGFRVDGIMRESGFIQGRFVDSYVMSVLQNEQCEG